MSDLVLEMTAIKLSIFTSINTAAKNQGENSVF